MAGLGPHSTSPHHAESANIHQQGELYDLEHGNHMDNQQEGSSQTHHISGSGYRRRSHLVHEQADEKDLQREIDDLKRKLRRAQRKQTPSSSDVSSNISLLVFFRSLTYGRFPPIYRPHQSNSIVHLFIIQPCTQVSVLLSSFSGFL